MLNCADPFMQLLKAPKKDYFITTPDIAHFQNCTRAWNRMSWCTVSRKANKFAIIRRLKISFNLLWLSFTKSIWTSKIKIFWNHLLIKFSWSIICQMSIKISVLGLSVICNLSNIYLIIHLRIHISRTWWFSKHLLVVAWKAKNPHNSLKKILFEYLKEEYSIFCVFLKLMIGIKYKQIHGTVFARIFNDGFMMANNKKYHSLALQFIDHFWKNSF